MTGFLTARGFSRREIILVFESSHILHNNKYGTSSTLNYDTFGSTIRIHIYVYKMDKVRDFLEP